MHPPGQRNGPPPGGPPATDNNNDEIADHHADGLACSVTLSGDDGGAMSADRFDVDTAGRLADMWDHALKTMYRLGYGEGYRRGVVDGRNEESDAWQKIMGVWRATVAQPTFAELQRRRGEAP